ncbi:MAG TPA: L-aspartate oxidase [Fimbriimonadaceae bacterium]|nr:L-aspartate oxidase [Fimbriimonadaceae bacterium]
METLRYDFLVIGSGLAGLTFALQASAYGTVCVLTKDEVAESNTRYAQGGIAAAVGEADSWALHEADTLKAGAGLCDPEAVRFLVQRAPEAINWLIHLGTRFDQEQDGDLALGREGGHGMNRIVHHQDRTGWEVERAMTEAVQSNERITVFEHTFVTGLCMAGERCAGAEAIVDVLGPRRFLAGAVMLASGGCGRMYQHTTNPSVATADGIALASAVGATIRNMEFMQFHPTTLYHPQMRSFLISEAVRGAGATLRNHLGRRFMYDYDPRLELAPRDVVARAIDAEMKRLGTWCVYLDLTHLKPDRIKHEFPMIYEKLASIGLEIDKDWIPVVPAQHYSCGGVATDLKGMTSVPNLFAAGEVASTGVHGANRLASNSLLEALVFAAAAAEACASIKPQPGDEEATAIQYKCISESESIHIRRSLQKIMTDRVGIVRNNGGLTSAKRRVAELIKAYDAAHEAPFSRHPAETRNLLIAAQYVVQGAIDRKVNVGLHYNSDQV